jgi:hypothetical protein
MSVAGEASAGPRRAPRQLAASRTDHSATRLKPRVRPPLATSNDDDGLSGATLTYVNAFSSNCMLLFHVRKVGGSP